MSEALPGSAGPTLGSLFADSGRLLGQHAAPLLLLCAAGVGFEALLTYVGGFLTMGYGEPFFALISTVLQEVLYYGPATLLWASVLRQGAPSQTPVADEAPVGLDKPTLETLVSGFKLPRAWWVAVWVTLLYTSAASLLGCIGLVGGVVLVIWIPGAMSLYVKIIRSIVGPVTGLGYLATALAVAQPGRGVRQSVHSSGKLMIARPLVAGLVMSVGGFLEEAAGLTVLLGVILDAFLLCYSAALLRSMRERGELAE